MRLRDLIAHLNSRFPRDAAVLSAEIAVAAGGGLGIVEVVTFDDDDLEPGDDPEGGKPLPGPRLVS